MYKDGERSTAEICEADPAFMKACEEYNEKGFSPTLTKEQLRTTILLRRVSAGEEEPELDEKPDIKHPLTKEELTRIEARKKCNRLSARKCREKKKQENQQTIKTVKEEKEKKMALEKKISDMELEKTTMLNKLSETYSQLQSTFISPKNIMDLVNALIQNGNEAQQNDQDVHTATTCTQCPTVSQGAPVLDIASGLNCFGTSSDFHRQIGESLSGKHFGDLNDLQGQRSVGCDDIEMVMCSNNSEWNEFFAAEN